MELFDIAGSVGEGLSIIGRHAGELVLTTLAAPSRVKHFGAASHPLDIIRFSRDGRFALHRQQDDTIVVWRVDTMKPVQRFQAHPGRSHGFSIDDEGSRFALRQPDGRIHSYDLRAKRYLGSIDGPPGTLSYLTFTAKGEQLADVGDRYIRVTNAPKDAQVRSSAPSKRASLWAGGQPFGATYRGCARKSSARALGWTIWAGDHSTQGQPRRQNRCLRF